MISLESKVLRHTLALQVTYYEHFGQLYVPSSQNPNSKLKRSQTEFVLFALRTIQSKKHYSLAFHFEQGSNKNAHEKYIKVLPVSTFICVVTSLWESVSGRVKLNKWMHTHVKWSPLLFVLSLVINFHSFTFICAGKTNKSVTFYRQAGLLVWNSNFLSVCLHHLQKHVQNLF